MTDTTEKSASPAPKEIRSLGQAVRLNDLAAAKDMLAQLEEKNKVPSAFDFHALAMRLLIDQEKPNMELLDLLIENGANLSAVMPAHLSSRQDANTPIYPVFAILSANREETVLELVRTCRVSPEYADGGGVRLLMQALIEDRLKFSEELLALGANIDGQDIGQSTALHAAVSRQDVLIIDWLINHGASLSCENMARALPSECVPEGGLGDLLFESMEALREEQKTNPAATIAWPEEVSDLIKTEVEILEKIQNPSASNDESALLGLTPC
jgi:hypothetical protein